MVTCRSRCFLSFWGSGVPHHRVGNGTFPGENSLEQFHLASRHCDHSPRLSAVFLWVPLSSGNFTGIVREVGEKGPRKTVYHSSVVRPYDPWVAYQHLTSDELFSSLLAGFVVLILSLLGSVFYDRVFCKYLCPLGGFLGLLAKAGYFRIRRNEKTCIDCKACSRVCPVNIPVAELSEVTSSECISCNLCVNACPVENSLFVEGKRKVRVTPIVVLYATLGIFSLVLGVSTFAGGFAWSVKSIQEITLHTGQFNPDEIKGSDTWKAVSELSGIPKDEFMKTFALTEADFEGTLKNWAHKPGSTREVSEVRDYVKKRLGK